MLTVTEINALPVKVVYDSPEGIWEGKSQGVGNEGFLKLYPATAKLGKKGYSYNHSKEIHVPIRKIWSMQVIQITEQDE